MYVLVFCTVWAGEEEEEEENWLARLELGLDNGKGTQRENKQVRSENGAKSNSFGCRDGCPVDLQLVRNSSVCPVENAILLAYR